MLTIDRSGYIDGGAGFDRGHSEPPLKIKFYVVLTGSYI